MGGIHSLFIADSGRLLNAPCIAHAGRLLNALRQHTAHELKTSMDSLKMITAWDTLMLQVSRVHVQGEKVIVLSCPYVEPAATEHLRLHLIPVKMGNLYSATTSCMHTNLMVVCTLPIV